MTKMKTKVRDSYVYPAVFQYDEEEKVYNVFFPDIKGANTFGYSIKEAMENAKECLELNIYVKEDRNLSLNSPSDRKDILLENDDFIQYIEADMYIIRSEIENKKIKKNLTMPKWLSDLAKEQNINLSSLLVKALKKELKITRHLD